MNQKYHRQRVERHRLRRTKKAKKAAAIKTVIMMKECAARRAMMRKFSAAAGLVPASKKKKKRFISKRKKPYYRQLTVNLKSDTDDVLFAKCTTVGIMKPKEFETKDELIKELISQCEDHKVKIKDVCACLSL
ncbi:MAG: hypothetical protein ABIG69_06925 [Bacteroidota bacterium]